MYKSGDTMSGILAIESNLPMFVGRSTVLNKTSTTAPANNILGAILQTQDKNSNYVSNFITLHDTSNNFASIISLERTVGGTTKTASFAINVNPSGIDFANASAGVKYSITNWAFPSNTITPLTWGTDGDEYTAPKDGSEFNLSCNNITSLAVIRISFAINIMLSYLSASRIYLIPAL